MPAVDSTDFYMFNSYEPGRDGYVTLLANYLPLQDPYGGPNYFALDPPRCTRFTSTTTATRRRTSRFSSVSRTGSANNNNGIKLPIGGSQVAVPLKNVGPVSANDSSTLNFNESYSLTLVRGDRRKGQALPRHEGERRRHELRQAVRLHRHEDLRQRAGLQGLREASSSTT